MSVHLANYLLPAFTNFVEDEAGESLMEYALLGCLAVAVWTLVWLAMNKGA